MRAKSILLVILLASTVLGQGNNGNDKLTSQEFLQLFQEGVDKRDGKFLAQLISEYPDHAQVVALYLHNQGALAHKNGENDKAFKMLRYAFSLYSRLKNLPELSKVLILLADVYQNTGENEKVLPIYLNTLKVIKESKDRQAERATLSIIGHIYLNAGKYQNALKFANEALHLAE